MLQEIITGIEATGFIPGRSALVDEMQEYSVVVDGARTPMALSRLLDHMRECGPKRIWLVFGCQGEVDESARPLMGEIAHYKVTDLPISRYLGLRFASAVTLPWNQMATGVSLRLST